MSERDELSVFFRTQKVGVLGLGQDEQFQFAYDPAWFDAEDAFAISASLPLTKAPHIGEAAHWFFANLLPEGGVRTLIARRLGISEQNDFALLRAIGGECAGALVIGDENPKPEGYEPLTSEQLLSAARDGDALAQTTARAGVRLSLAGAQEKLPVRLDGDSFLLPKGASPSTHILKFPNHKFGRMPANEAFTMALANKLDLPVCETRLHELEGEQMLVVTRYDRIAEGDTIMRLHQEDMCQALGLPPGTKYEKEGGPSFANCVDIVSQLSDEPAADTPALIGWLAFCAIAFNADGHAKNLSLLRSNDGGWRLAPFYDLLCTGIYEQVDRNLAMRVGDSSDPGQIRGQDWARLANQAKLGTRFVTERVKELADRIEPTARECAAEFRDSYGDSPVLQQILPLIRKQARRTRELLNE